MLQLSNRLQFMVGREITHTSLRVPSVATVNFTGETVEQVWPLGKHLFMQIGERVLHTHLKMEGTWAVHLAGDRWRAPAHTARVVLRMDGRPRDRDIEVVGFSLGFVRVLAAADYTGVTAHLGPDVLAPDFDSAEAIRRIRLRPDRPIGTALLDQRNLAGVGNEYRAEVCFLAGVHPAAPVAGVDVARIVSITRRLMWANRLSPVRVSTGVRRPGDNSYVFGRAHQPCRRCGTLIHKASLGAGDAGELERIIWWCPSCQGYPAPGR